MYSLGSQTETAKTCDRKHGTAFTTELDDEDDASNDAELFPETKDQNLGVLDT